MAGAKAFICLRCGYDTDVKAHYVAHLKIKNACEPRNSSISREELLEKVKKPERKCSTAQCAFCDKIVSRKNMHRHHSACSGKHIESQAQDTPSNTVIENSTASNVSNAVFDISTIVNTPEFRQLLDQVVDQRVKDSRMVQNNYYIQQNHATYILNAFGNEDMSHITHDFLSHCLLNPTKGITHLIDTIHYSQEVPSNRNLRFKSTKNNTMEKYVNAHWTECDATNTLDELIKKGYRILNSHYMEHFMNNPTVQDNEVRQRAIERFRFLGDKTCNEYHSVKRDLRLLIKDRTMYLVGIGQP